MAIDFKRRPAEDVPAALIALWAKENGIKLTFEQAEMLTFQVLVSQRIAVESAVATARASAFTEAAQAMCVHCKKGLSGDKQFNHFVDDGLQPRGEKGRIVRCFAAPIWNIASQAACRRLR